jgi:hypothetical protein
MFRPLLIAGIAFTLTACASPARFSDLLPGAAPAPAAVAPAPVDSPEVRLVGAIENQGCVLTASNVGSVLLAANLTQQELVEITPRLADAGRVEVAGDGAIRVLTDRCTTA